MAAVFRQITKTTWSSGSLATRTATFDSGISAGSIILAACGALNTLTTLTLSDGSSDTYTDSGLGLIDATGPGLKYRVGAFFTASTGVTTVTATFTGTAPTIGELYIYEVTGLTSATFDKFVRASGNSTSADSGTTGTLSSSDEAAIAYGCTATTYTGAGTSWSTGNGTIVGTNTGDGISASTSDLGEHRILAATTAINGTGPVSPSGAWDIACVTAMSGVASGPFSIEDISPPPGSKKPYPQDLRTWIKSDLLDTTLNSKDKQFGAAGQTQTYDWPNQLGSKKAYPQDLRTWIKANLLETTLKNQDKQFGGAGQGQTYDWPNPPGSKRAYQNDLRTWSAFYNRNLIGKDTLPENNFDWPLPGRRKPIDPIWVQNLLESTLGVAQALPFNQDDWPLQLGNRRPYPIDLRTWAAWFNLNLVGQDNVLLPFDWGTTGRQPRIDQTWAQNLLESTLLPLPENQYDWPLPGRRQPLNPTWFQNLLESTLAATTPLPENQSDWPLQLGNRRPYPNELRTWTGWYNQNLIGKDILPENQFDWPLQLGNKQAYQNDLRTWAASYNQNLIGQDNVILPFDWGLTGRYPRLDQTWLINLLENTLLNNPFPENQYNWPVPLGSKRAYQIDFRTWAAWYNQNLIGKDTLPKNQSDWPLPRRPLRPNNLGTIINANAPIIPASAVDEIIHNLPFFATFGKLKSF